MTTEHSKKLRHETALKAYHEGVKSGRIKQYSIRGDSELITEQLQVIDSMPGESRVEKMQALINKFTSL